MIRVRVEFVKLDEMALAPTIAYGDDAGWDLHVLQPTLIEPGEGRDVRSGIAMALPTDFYARIIGRSSALRKRGLLVVEGIIDAGFRGELFSYAFNPGTKEVWLAPGESIAQIIVQKRCAVQWVQTLKLPDSQRGEQGFGSSGL